MPEKERSWLPSTGTWLITGGCGFIGTRLIRKLVTAGDRVAIRVVDNLSVGTREDLSSVCRCEEISVAALERLTAAENLSDSGDPSVQLIVGEIRDDELALKVARDVDIIVHLAANTGVAPSVEDPRQDFMANVLGTLNYLEAARHNHVKRFVFASSGAPVGECTPPIHEELAPHPVSPYGAGKLSGEGYCSAYWRTYGVETVSLRFGNVYGPGSGHKNSVVAKFIRQAFHGETLEIYGSGEQTRDFIYIDDLVRAICSAAAVEGIGGETFQIATHSETAVNELRERLSDILKGHPALQRPVQVCYGDVRRGDVMRNYSDTSKARKVLGWQAEVPLEKGLEKTVQWFLNTNF